MSQLEAFFWGNKAKARYLFLAAFLLLFTFLGARELWTQEHRWADIVFGMFYRHDFLHPYLGSATYYDKPLLSYWLIVVVAKIIGHLNAYILRIPSACAALLAIGAIYQIGTSLRDKQLGLIAGWLLLTTFYFIFWARTSSADMLNLSGSLCAIAWYLRKRTQITFFNCSIFFIIIALTALCKGLIGAVVPLLAVSVDIILQRSWRQYLKLSCVLAVFPAFIMYLIPFLASSYVGGESYQQNGLYLVYRENILRYFHPFDHQGPIYTYFIYLPIYLLPWTFFFIPALYTLPQRFKAMSLNSKWIVSTTFVLFLFFTLSGSRRSYYVLPIVPFAILWIADWIRTETRLKKWMLSAIMMTFIGFFLAFDLLPAWYYAIFGANQFAQVVKRDASKIHPWADWQVVTLDSETKLNFYLQLPPTTQNYPLEIKKTNIQQLPLLEKTHLFLKEKHSHTIFLSRKNYEPLLKTYFPNYRVIELPVPASLAFLEFYPQDAPIAFIPNYF